MKVSFIYIVVCIAFTVFGQLLIKKGTLINIKGTVLGYLNIYILTGLLSASIVAVSWIMALKHYRLSYAYPFMSISFLLVAIFSWLIFGEEIKATQWIGLVIVITGLIIGSQ